MRKILSVSLAILFIILCVPITRGVENKTPFDVNADSAVLIDLETGTVLYAKNEDLALPPASVTKIMTLLLFIEEVDKGNISLDENISVSEYAASMPERLRQAEHCPHLLRRWKRLHIR